MRLQKKLLIASLILSVVSFCVALILGYLSIDCEWICKIHYDSISEKIDFWVDVSLGVFSGAILTLMTSIISYLREKRKTLEDFVYNTRHLLNYLNNYQEGMSIEQKLRFFIDYSELEKSKWDQDLGDIDFLFDFSRKKIKYIYKSIYKPIIDFNIALNNYIPHFRMHLSVDDTKENICKNDAMIERFILELQDYLITKTEEKLPTKYDNNGDAIEYCRYSSTVPKLVLNVRKEFNGRYYEIMYGKKFAKKQRKLFADKKNN